MKVLFFIIFIFLLKNELMSQVISNIDSIIIHNSKRNFKTIDLLVEELVKGLVLNEDKYRVLYGWICYNINYQSGFGSSSNQVYKAKKGDCEVIALLYKDMCNLIGLECEVVEGYTKTKNEKISFFRDLNHSWNAIKLDNEWLLCDVTWEIGSNYNDKIITNNFFNSSPEIFGMTHYPSNKKWFITSTYPSKNQFNKYVFVYAFYFEMNGSIVEFNKNYKLNSSYLTLKVKKTFNTNDCVLRNLDNSIRQVPIEVNELNSEILELKFDLSVFKKNDVITFYANSYAVLEYSVGTIR